MTKTFDQLKITAEKNLKLRQSIEIVSFARLLGLPLTLRYRTSGAFSAALSESAKDTILALEKAGVIKVVEPTIINKSTMIYSPDWQPKPVIVGKLPECKTYIDPSIVRPVPKAVVPTAKPIAKAARKHQQEVAA